MKTPKHTNLEYFCKELGWQGGTIHQVSDEFLSMGLSAELCKTENLIKMSEDARSLFVCLYKAKKEVKQ